MKEFTESRLALGAGELWDLGTRAEFLNAVGDGSLPEDVFNRWLVQDYLFVRGFAGFASLTIGKTPRPGQSVLIAGLSALDDELGWFEAHAEARSLDLGAELHPACQGRSEQPHFGRNAIGCGSKIRLRRPIGAMKCWLARRINGPNRQEVASMCPAPALARPMGAWAPRYPVA